MIFAAEELPTTKVYIIKTRDRQEGINRLLRRLDPADFTDKKVIIKANFNSDDPFPATTHLDTVRAVVRFLKMGTPESISILERSGMGRTTTVLENRGVFELGASEEVGVVDLDELVSKQWVRVGQKGTHWRNGFLIPKMVQEADFIVNLPCLKTHRFGGDFTMALKNNVGLVAKWDRAYNYMWELHGSPNQRKMIAEINLYVPSNLIILDALEGFSTEGPDKGTLITPEAMLMSSDPVAIDAVGVAMLRLYGTTPKVSRGRIFDQDQLRRAVELGIGVTSPAQIEVVAVNKEAEALAGHIREMLDR